MIMLKLNSFIAIMRYAFHLKRYCFEQISQRHLRGFDAESRTRVRQLHSSKQK